MMGIHPRIAASVAVEGLVAMIDEQDRICVGQRLRSGNGRSGDPIFVRNKIVGFAGAIERREPDRLLIEVIFKQAIMTSRPTMGEAC